MENRCGNCTSYNGNSRIVEYASILLANAFVVQNCLYVISDDCFLSSLIERSLTRLEKAIVVLSRDSENDGSDCDGYVVVSKNFTFLRGLFAETTRFKVHRRAIIFFDGRRNFLTRPFTLLAAQHASDLYVVQGFWGAADLKLGDLEIIDVYTKRSLPKINFERRTWQPDFMADPTLKFRAAAFNCSPFVMVNEDNVVFDGVEHKILREITQSWPFQYNVYKHTFEDDLYLEVTSDILNGTSDIALGFHWLTFTLRRNADTSYPYTQACATFLVPKPLFLPDITFVFQPMTQSLWLVLLVVIFLAALSLFASANYYVRYHGGGRGGFDNFAVCLLNLLAILVINTLKRFPPPSQSVFRLIITAWCFICVVLSTGYSAGFSSLLTYPKFFRRINTLQDMIDAKIYWGEASAFTRDYLASSERTQLVQIANLFQVEDSVEVKLSRLRKNTHATIATVLPDRFLTGTFILDDYAKTHLRVLYDCFGLYFVVFALPKNSPYKKLIQEKIIRYTEHGFVAHWYTEILAKYDYMNVNNYYTLYAEPVPAQHVPLAVAKIKGALLLLVVGLTCSALVFLAEMVWTALKSKKLFRALLSRPRC